EVVRGDLTVTVSGSGNTEISNEMKLAFGIGGRVDKIYVAEGDNVTEGKVLARLETDDLELALTRAQVAYTQAQVAVTEAEVAITQAEVARQTAEYELEEAQELFAEAEIRQARTAVSEARSYLEYAERQLTQASITSDILRWSNEVAFAREKLRAAEVRLDEMLATPDTREVALKRLQVALAEQSLELVKQSLEPVKQSLELARQSLEQARRQLDKATITALFAGVVAAVAVDEKDTVSPTITIIHLIDPDSMELEVQVDEIDVPGVKTGQRAIIEVDALPTLPLEGMVSFISLLPAIEAGVTVYDVKIRFDVPEGIGLRVGMSASVDIIIAEGNNVLLVPDRAIKQDNQGNPIVEVMVNERIEERAVVIGSSDGYQTEILEGLEEGEKVVERRSKPKPSKSGLF
ncbi:MAG: efflux RND transporter periplasmic adaptor subunit, partial [Chloroflexi bacterium]|nr:efflux RND transporter periplasmic adaptor subunit [Chloroflexota bacterium]